MLELTKLYVPPEKEVKSIVFNVVNVLYCMLLQVHGVNCPLQYIDPFSLIRRKNCDILHFRPLNGGAYNRMN